MNILMDTQKFVLWNIDSIIYNLYYETLILNHAEALFSETYNAVEVLFK